MTGYFWSGGRDLNPGPSDPQSDALAKLRHRPVPYGPAPNNRSMASAAPRFRARPGLA